MSNVFGQHELALPFRSTADILTGYAKRDPAKTAIVDLDQGTSITFGSLNQASIDVASDLKRRGVITATRSWCCQMKCWKSSSSGLPCGALAR